MAEFIGSPIVEWLPPEPGKRRKLRLTRGFMYRATSRQIITMPRGMTTDLASVPKLVPGIIRAFLPGPLESAWAAILHDRLYQTHEVTRARADALLYEALRLTESRTSAWLFWAAVRVGGHIPWRRRGR